MMAYRDYRIDLDVPAGTLAVVTGGGSNALVLSASDAFALAAALMAEAATLKRRHAVHLVKSSRNPAEGEGG